MKKKLLFAGAVTVATISVVIPVLQSPMDVEPLFRDHSTSASDPASPSRSEQPAESEASVNQPDQEAGRTAMATAADDPVRLSDIPDGDLKAGLGKLPLDVQKKVLKRLSAERQLLVDIDSIRVDSNGMVYYVCSFGVNPMGNPDFPQDASDMDGAQSDPDVSAALVPISSLPVLHSRPGAPRVLFLDFDGHVIQNTAWNKNANYNGTGAAWDCLPYDTDNDPDTFSATELANITQIWQRVAEDYAPFDVDITTEQPANWTSKTGHALITPTKDRNELQCPHYGLGGVAYIDVFGESDYSYGTWYACYSPAWVSGEMSVSSIAEAASHELGHNLGLHHDGTSSVVYYTGHSNGSISWAPIMGTGYTRNVTQWSKGEYYNSNNPEDDLVLIKNKLKYRLDDYGDENGTATTLSLDSGGAIMQEGVIETTGDIDVFSFFSGGGDVTIEVAPYRASGSTWGGNLDILLQLFNSSGSLMASASPEAEAGTSITTSLEEGTYYLYVNPEALGTPTASPPTGYTVYAVLGQYSITGSISADADGDGLPNEWELMYFDGNTNAVASFDDDDDGTDNLTEYIAGTNPREASSVFKVTSFYTVPTIPDAYVVRWNSMTGRVYNVGWSDSLSSPFMDISGDIPYPGNSYTDAVERAGNQQFYRIEIR